jgi:FixJ family two-component response regulator
MEAVAATEDLMAVQQLASLTLSDEERAELRSLTMRRKTAQALALRARIVLTCAEGGQNKEVAAKLGLDRSTVGKWRRRSWSGARTGCMTSRAPGRHVRLTMLASKP